MGQALKAVRTERGLTQREVAEKYGSEEGNIAAYEQGRNRFTVQDLPRLAQALGVPTSYLARRLGLCGDDSADIAQALVERFGPKLGQALVRLDRILARIEQDDTTALTVTICRHVEHYEVGLNG
jgi:transcriptional regulator with XRE-family HTH domain